jgi:hypothetical protein
MLTPWGAWDKLCPPRVDTAKRARVYAYVYGKGKKEYPESDGFWEPEPGKQSRRGNVRKRKTPAARITETGGRINKCGWPK